MPNLGKEEKPEVASNWKVEVAVKTTFTFSNIEKPLTAKQVMERVLANKFPEKADFKEQRNSLCYIISTEPLDEPNSTD